jgi:cytochrome P450
MGLLEGVFRTRFASRMQPFAGMPGPTPAYPLGTLTDFKGAKPWDVCAGYEKKYGGMTLIWEFGKPVVVVNDADLIREVLVTNEKDYWKDDPTEAFRPVLRVTEFNENGPEWKRLRDAEPLSMAGFNEWLPSQIPAITKVADAHIDRLLASGEQFNFLPKIERMVYDAYNACIVGRQLDDDLYSAFYTTSNMATKRMLLPKWLLVRPISPSFWAAMTKHFGVYEQIVREAKQNLSSNANDLLHVYLRKGTTVSDEQIAMYLGNVHAGGVFSAGTAIVDTLYLLAKHPEVEAKLRSELTSSANGSRYLDQVLHESLRYYPPVPMFFRNVLKTKSTTLGGFNLPPNTVVYLVVQGVHRSARYWNYPERFDPERWHDGPVSVDAYEADTFLPFGRGPRICVGATLAMLCMRIILASIVRRTQLKIDPSLQLEQFFHCGVAEPKNVVGKLAALP